MRQQRRYARGLDLVERQLAAVTSVYPGRLGEACVATLAAGGKRLRPLLTLMCARRDRDLDERVRCGAAAVELLHMASLVHDDVLDRAALRRGQPTVACEYGPEMAVSVGNFLYAQAFVLVVATGEEPAVRLLSDTAVGLSEGEVLQRADAHRPGVSRGDYKRRCELKTAALFAAACRLGAALSGADERAVAAVDEYGRLIGLAFQVFDDILDVCGDETRTGKQVGTDVRDGTITLPVILALETHPGLAPLLSRAGPSPEVVATVLDVVVRSGAVERARAIALGYIEEAQSVLAACPDYIERELLAEVAAGVVDRYS